MQSVGLWLLGCVDKPLSREPRAGSSRFDFKLQLRILFYGTILPPAFRSRLIFPIVQAIFPMV
jgi:hypothetical protein